MKVVFSVFAVVLLFACSTIGVPGGRVGAAGNIWKLSVKEWSGSAFPVSSVQNDTGQWVTLFLTAHHVVDGVDTGWDVNLDGNYYIGGGVVLSQHATRDAALVLFLSPKYIQPVTLDARDARFGEVCWAAGYPAAKHLVITQGLIGRSNQGSANVYFGNSGGAVIDSGGRVIGIVVSMLADPPDDPEGKWTILEHVMYFVPVTELADWLRSYGINT